MFLRLVGKYSLLIHLQFYFPEHMVMIHPVFGYLESPVVNITSESCMMIKYKWRPVGYVNQTSFRVITNTSDNLNVLTYIDTRYQDSISMSNSWHTGHAGLPVGRYSVIIEAQGIYVQIARVSMLGRECDGKLATVIHVLTLSDWSKLKEFADDNFKFDKNGRKLSKQVENTVGKRRDCLLKQFFPFSTTFSKDLYCRHVKTGA